MFELPRDEEKDDGIATTVVFRRYLPTGHVAVPNGTDGGIIALFPFIPADDNPRHCSSYQHVGQHGAADYRHVVETTVAVLPEDEEKMELKVELENIGYTVEEFTNEEACFEAGFMKGQKEAKESARAVIGDCTSCKSTNCMLRDCMNCGESVCDECVRSGKKQSEELAYCALCA